MKDEDNGLTRERDRRVQGGILIAMVVMVAVGVVGAYFQVLMYHGGGGRLPEDYPESVIQVDVARPDWARFVEAADQFAAGRGLVLWASPAGLPVKDSTLAVGLFYRGDDGIQMTVDTNQKGEFVVKFIDKGKSGAERRLESGFQADVVDAGGFRISR